MFFKWLWKVVALFVGRKAWEAYQRRRRGRAPQPTHR